MSFKVQLPKASSSRKRSFHFFLVIFRHHPSSTPLHLVSYINRSELSFDTHDVNDSSSHLVLEVVLAAYPSVFDQQQQQLHTQAMTYVK